MYVQLVCSDLCVLGWCWACRGAAAVCVVRCVVWTINVSHVANLWGERNQHSTQ